MNTKTQAQTHQPTADGTHTIGHIVGSAKVRVSLEFIPVKDGGDHPARVYGKYAEQMVHQLMEKYHSIPTEITIALHYDAENT